MDKGGSRDISVHAGTALRGGKLVGSGAAYIMLLSAQHPSQTVHTLR